MSSDEKQFKNKEKSEVRIFLMIIIFISFILYGLKIVGTSLIHQVILIAFVLNAIFETKEFINKEDKLWLVSKDIVGLSFIAILKVTIGTIMFEPITVAVKALPQTKKTVTKVETVLIDTPIVRGMFLMLFVPSVVCMYDNRKKNTLQNCYCWRYNEW